MLLNSELAAVLNGTTTQYYRPLLCDKGVVVVPWTTWPTTWKIQVDKADLQWKVVDDC